ncbi:MAG TPA: hypothetical protein VLC92_01225 [Rhodocyclaceae bacterium]|nr:hypothetical protein [Rhodocyclaceae bacterium]
MADAKSNRALLITIKCAKGLTQAEYDGIAEKVRATVGDDKYAIGVQEVTGSDRVYVGARPDKKQRLDTIQKMESSMTAQEVADSLGLSRRQVCRYKAFLRALTLD